MQCHRNSIINPIIDAIVDTPAFGFVVDGSVVENAVAFGITMDAASQGIMIATGEQKGFNFGELALAGVGAFIGEAIGEAVPILPGVQQLDGFLKQAGAGGQLISGVNHLIGNGLTQGLDMAIGLQKQFDGFGMAESFIMGMAAGAPPPQANASAHDLPPGAPSATAGDNETFERRPGESGQ